MIPTHEPNPFSFSRSVDGPILDSPLGSVPNLTLTICECVKRLHSIQSDQEKSRPPCAGPNLGYYVSLAHPSGHNTANKGPKCWRHFLEHHSFEKVCPLASAILHGKQITSKSQTSLLAARVLSSQLVKSLSKTGT